MPFEFQIPEGYSLEVVWETDDEALIDEITQFLLAESAYKKEERARSQAASSAIIARDPRGESSGPDFGC